MPGIGAHHEHNAAAADDFAELFHDGAAASIIWEDTP
jgi:hypothetical protein